MKISTKTYMFTHICLYFAWIGISTCTTTTVKFFAVKFLGLSSRE